MQPRSKHAHPGALISLKEKLIKIGAKVTSHGRHVAFQMAEVAIPRQLFADILRLVAKLWPPPEDAKVSYFEARPLTRSATGLANAAYSRKS